LGVAAGPPISSSCKIYLSVLPVGFRGWAVHLLKLQIVFMKHRDHVFTTMSSLIFDQHFAFLKWPAGQAWRHTKWHGHERAQAKLLETKCFTNVAGCHVKTSPQTGTLINNYQCAGLRDSFEIAVF
jgi:hypothetical protein